ncbi:MAG TPA: hypothetical protein VIY08_16155, partial [Candidatus Nitrosocosmicus sp.]
TLHVSMIKGNTNTSRFTSPQTFGSQGIGLQGIGLQKPGPDRLGPVNLITKCDRIVNFTHNSNVQNSNSKNHTMMLNTNSIMSMATSVIPNNSGSTNSRGINSDLSFPCVMTGTVGPDIIVGPARTGSFSGSNNNGNGNSGGNDGGNGGDLFSDIEIIKGLAGNDVILCGSQSICTITTGPGDSILRAGGATQAKLYAGAGNNIFIGGEGDSLMVGNLGNDIFYAGTGHDTMIGGPGKNYFDCGLSGNAVILNYNPILDTKAGNCKYIVYVRTPFPVLP